MQKKPITSPKATRPQAAASAPAASGEAAVAKGSSRNGPLPLSQRKLDLIIALWFAIFAFSTTFTDIHNFTASYLGVKVSDLKGMTLAYPPKALTDVYFEWAETVDPLLYANPIWWQCIEWVNLCVLTPYAFIAVVAFLKGWEWSRVPSIVVSAFTSYSLVLCMGSTLYGTDEVTGKPFLPDPLARSVFLGVYVIYFFMPLFVIARLWGDKPFSTPLSGSAAATLGFLMTSILAIFFSYCAKWFPAFGTQNYPALAEALAPTMALP